MVRGKTVLKSYFFQQCDKYDGVTGAKRIILEEVQKLYESPSEVRQDGCAACHVLFTLIYKCKSQASDLLSQIFFHNPQLNDPFIEMVESIHMKQRKMVSLALK